MQDERVTRTTSCQCRAYTMLKDYCRRSIRIGNAVSSRVTRRILRYHLETRGCHELGVTDQGDEVYEMTSRLDHALQKLRELGANELDHINGDLAQHLKGDYALLEAWSNPEPVCMAGLYHATYGTQAFPAELLPLARRRDVAAIIGEEAEELVYFYAACDREYTYRRIISGGQPVYRDRFTERSFQPDPMTLAAFSELTLANELEISIENHEHRERYRRSYVELFTSFEGLVSPRAFRAYLDCFGLSVSDR
jgi:hypothetical protein